MKLSKKMRDLLAEIEMKTKAAETAYEAGEKEKGNGLLAEIADLRKDFEAEKQMQESRTFFEANADEGAGKAADPATFKTADGGVAKDTERSAFFKAAREGFPKRKSINNEGTAGEGGYTVPVDIVTKVERFRDAQAHLLPFVRRVPVSTNSGARTFLSRATHTAFSEVSEGGKIGKKDGPAFQRLTYTIKKYAGYMAATDELLADSDERIEAFLTEWLGKAAAKTYDTLILAAIATKPADALDGLDGIKQAINVTLGSTFADTTRIYTNDDGLNWLDTLKDGNDRYLLSPDPANAMQMRLAVGARFIPITVLPNVDLPSTAITSGSGETATVTGYKYPFILGDLNEGIANFDRQSLSVKASDTAVVGSGDNQLNAYEEDLTLLRGILRTDVKVRDAAAFVNGYVQVSVS